jgi:proteasome accessory factor B
MRVSARPLLARLAQIDAMVRTGRHPTVGSLATALEVNRRTIQRDLGFLRDRLGAPIVHDPGAGGFVYTDHTYHLPLWQFSEGELVGLLLAERLLQEYRHTPYADALKKAFDKIAAALPDAVTIDLAHLADALAIRHQALKPPDADILALLVRAVQKGEQLKLVYWAASRDETTRRIVDPYHLASVNGDLFLVAYCHLREEVRMFSPARIRKARPTGRRTERPADFRIAEYLDVAFRAVRGAGPARAVRLRFRPAMARYIRERKWHATQKLAEEADGNLLLTLRVNHLLEVKRWALSFGADCEVLEPPELREELLSEAKRINQLYGNA